MFVERGLFVEGEELSSLKGWREKLYIIIFEADTPEGKIFDIVLLLSILLSTFVVILESDPEIRTTYGAHLQDLEWFFTIVFSLEYGLRILCARSVSGYMKSFFGVVDFIAIVPTYLSLFFPGAQFLLLTRVIRLLRIFRVLKLVRYSQESRVLVKALRSSQYKVTVFLGVVVTFILILGTIMHLVEEGNPGFSSISEGVYWAVVTMTTVGYGDVVPLTGLGKFLAAVIMIMGYGVIAVPTGILSAEISSSSNFTPNESNQYCSSCGVRFHRVEINFCHECGSQQRRQNK